MEAEIEGCRGTHRKLIVIPDVDNVFVGNTWNKRETLTLRLSGRSPQTHLFYPGTQSGRLDPQKLRGSIHAFDSPVGLLQDSKKVLALAAAQF